MNQENKISYGLKNAHYATYKIEGDKVVFSTPIPMPGSVELSLEPRGDLIEFYADDMVYYSAQNNQGYNGTLTIATIKENFAQDCLGETMDEEDGVITESQGSEGDPFALMFEFDGDIQAVRHLLYNCTANRPTVASGTKTNSVEPKTSELPFVSNPHPVTRNVKTRTSSKTKAEIYSEWYKKVYEKSALPEGA